MSANRRVIVVGGVVLLAALLSAVAVSRAGGDDPAAGLTVGWGGSEGHPSCAYVPTQRTVEAKIAIDGRTTRRTTVSVTVTAHADENTSQPVGSTTRRVSVDGKVHQNVLVVIPVAKEPHRGEDGETACTLSVDYGDRKSD